MSIAVISSPDLARKVAEKLEPAEGTSIVPVPELVSSRSAQCDSTDLLSWMGWMTAGPPTLAADVLRSAGRWAWVRYRWALEDKAGIVRPTPDARSIRQHTRSTFSEAVGIGAAGFLGCLQVLPTGVVAVANLDDTIDPLLRSGVIRRRPGSGRKQPDYLIARGLGAGAPELLAIECKGTVQSEGMAIRQLVAGVRQTLGVESDFPLRRVVFATSLELDTKAPEVRCYAIEVGAEDGSEREPKLRTAQEALLDAALIRSLRCAGRYEEAERVREGYAADWVQAEPTFEIGGRPMAGSRAELASGDSRLVAEVGVDLNFLRTLAAPPAERWDRLQPAINAIPSEHEGFRQRTPLLDGLHQETMMRDGVGIRVEIHGWRLVQEEG